MKHKTIKHTLHIIMIVVLGWLCYQTHQITDGLEQLAQQQFRYEQITQYGTLCNIEHQTSYLDTE